MDKFVHLHRHDEYSLFDGMGNSKNASAYTAEIEQPALALTNHGNVSGIVNHFHDCKDAGIKPIIGCEAYFVPSLAKADKKKLSFHLTVLAKNDIGYKNLMQLMTRANEEGFYYKPRFDFDLLEQHKEGLIVLSGCQAGLIPKLLYKGDNKRAEYVGKRFKNMFGDDFYLEVQPHNMNDQTTFNKLLVDFGEALDIPVVMTSDAHYIKSTHKSTHDVMRAMKSGFGGYDGAYLMTRKEMLDFWATNHNFGKAKQYCSRTLEIAEKCDVQLAFKNLVPTINFGMESKKMLRNIAIRGLKDKNKFTEEYVSRLKMELKVIYDKGFEDYFLICWDIITWAKNNGIKSNFGRGSVGGSLLAYAIGITEVDPLIHNTVFERFLRPDKTAIPDIDMDFDKRYRDKVIKYIDTRFPDRSAPIIAYGLYRTKNLMNELSKQFGISDQDKEEMVTRLIDKFGEDATEIDYNEIKKDARLKRLSQLNKYVLFHFSNLFGQISYFGKHASAVAICGQKISNYVGLMKSHGNMVTSCNWKEVEKLGILKMDILGLETCSVISIAEELTGVTFNETMLRDKKVIKMFQQGKTHGIFQFEKRSVQELLRAVSPKNFEEIIACSALNRPAPIKLGVLDAYIDAKRGNLDKETHWYEYTKETYGTVIYQEQVMKICRGLAGLEWTDTDKIMKSLRKADDPDDPLLTKFIEGASKNGVDEKVAEQMYNDMTKYLFNKAHATAYTLLSYYSMWLLVYYPLEFLFALLSLEANEDKRRTYEVLAAGYGIVILPPHVNGTANYSIGKVGREKVIQAGLTSIKGVGEKVAEEICSKGPFKIEEMVEDRVPKRFFNSRVQKILQDNGSMIFDKKRMVNRIVEYNSRLKYEFGRRFNTDEDKQTAYDENQISKKRTKEIKPRYR